MRKPVINQRLQVYHWLLWLLVSVAICATRFVAEPGASHPTFVEKQIGKDGASTKFSYFNTSPESPDGKQITYLRFKKEPIGLKRDALVPGELWICDRDLNGHRMVTTLRGISSEDGCFQQWVDNQHVALLDSGVIRVLDVRNGKDILKKKIDAEFLGHDPFDGNILFTVSNAKGKGKPGVYELNCFTEAIKPVILAANCGTVALPAYLDPKQVWTVDQWRFFHCQYSPNGKKICFRLDVGKPENYQLLGVCNVDGSNLTVQTKALHHMWYDNESIMGHARFDDNGKNLSADKKFLLMRWGLDGKYIETLGIKGNHLAASPNRDWFVSETMYYLSPVIVTLTPKGEPNKAVEITRFDPYDITWNRFFHVNPAFSRDGKRVYYSKPLNEHYNGTFYCELK